ncbi:hypothetical protein SAY86_030438 [Trapa natans]|uniref:Uncharacterized protein n=1 Tax=Trapa natans TaxID=22666 RepID=A0AAN7MG25_TRANT|nr:hypothetical protein SAY86_030438 [Trapa natans]
MASLPSGPFTATPSPLQRMSMTSSSRVLQGSLGEETIWNRLKEAGFNEELIKRRDKAALIAYIANLEAEVFNYQHQMDLLRMDNKELTSRFEQIKVSADAAGLKYKRDQAAHVSLLAEARKREENLKKALGVEKECMASIEKALHEMRAETAEAKIYAQGKLIEARKIMEDAYDKLAEAESKLRAAESLETDSSRHRQCADRKLQEVEYREDDLNRRITSFSSECDAKEKEILNERKSLGERQLVLHKAEKALLEGQILLSQREEYITTRSQELSLAEKALESAKGELEKQRRALNNERSDLDLRASSLSEREQTCIQREALVNIKEQEMLILQEKIASKGSNEIQMEMANQESALKLKKSELEAELEMKRKMIDNEIETKRRAWELRELDLQEREDQLKDREHELKTQFKGLTEREKDLSERLNNLDKREKAVRATEQEIDLKNIQIHKEKEEICKLKQDLQSSVDLLEDKRKQVVQAQDKLEVMKTETDELSVLVIKLKEELDRVRAEKHETMVEADKLKAEKAKFEAQWESIDEKRDELKKEAERVAEEKIAVSKLLKEGHDTLRIERDAIRDQCIKNAESLRAEREEFMDKISQEHSEWFSKIQQERLDIFLEFETQKKELENSIDKRREELENSLREKEKAFEHEKRNELQYISSLKENALKEMDHVASEMKRLERERMEVNLDCERREKEWVELNTSIEELRQQREKLRKQRELLHADREEICVHIEQLKQLEDLKIASEKMAVDLMRQSALESSLKKMSELRSLKQSRDTNNVSNGNEQGSLALQRTSHASPSSARFSWIRRAADLIFKTPEKSPSIYKGELLTSEFDKVAVPPGRQLINFSVHKTPTVSLCEKNAVGEEKMIFEVPNLDKDVIEIHTLEPETCEGADKQYVQPRRKRRGSNFLATNLPESGKNKKKRLEELAGNQSEASNSNRTNKGLSVPDDLPISQSLNDNQVKIEETRILIVEEVSAAASKTIDNENFHIGVSKDHQQRPHPISDENAASRQEFDNVFGEDSGHLGNENSVE